MPTFQIDSGRLRAVSPGGALVGGFTEQWCAAVSADVLSLTGTDAFAVGWDDDPAVLTAMTSAGRTLVAAVVASLDTHALMGLVVSAGRIAGESWLDVASRYRRGVAAFRRDWNAFRESRTAGAAPDSRLVVVAGDIAPGVREALRVLDRVRLVQAQVRRTEQGDLVLDLHDVDRRAGPRGAPVAPARPESEVATKPVPLGRPSDLRLVADLVDAPVEIEADQVRATLDPSGTVVTADGASYDDLVAVSADLLEDTDDDPWQRWRFVQWQAPLAEARSEVSGVRSNGHSPRSGRHRRGQRVT